MELLAEGVYLMDSLKQQVGGNHYKIMKIQVWEIVDALGLDYYTGNVLKYILRKKTNRIEDLEKAKHYIDHMIELEKARG